MPAWHDLQSFSANGTFAFALPSIHLLIDPFDRPFFHYLQLNNFALS